MTYEKITKCKFLDQKTCPFDKFTKFFPKKAALIYFYHM